MQSHYGSKRGKFYIKHKDAFTIIELMVVIAVIGVLSVIGIISFSNIQADAKNAQKSSNIKVISEALEKYYTKNGSYPTCASIANPVSSTTVTTNILKGLDPNALTAPGATKGTNSITTEEPTTSTFGCIGDGTDYTLKYKEEGSGAVILLDGRYHTSTPTYILTIVADPGGTVNNGDTYSAGTVQTITATPNAYYSFSNWTGSTGCSGVASHSITMDANKTCTAHFTPTAVTPPSAPVVTANTVGSTTTWSWPIVTCSAGNTVKYQYRYTILPAGFDGGWIETSNTSVAMTTSTQGQTYRVDVQARCYNSATTSAWSATNSPAATYYRPITYTLTLAGANCTFTGGGTYTEGSVVTMACNPTSTYYFNYWTDVSGSGCVGSASHSITMNANKSCAATSTHWIPSNDGSLVGKYVYYKDLSSPHEFKVNTNADNDTWSIMGGDSAHPNQRVLRNPNTYPGNSLNWASWYPSQNACQVTTGGRVPNNDELGSIFGNISNYNKDYGFSSNTGYGSSNESTDYYTTKSPTRNSTTNAYADSIKTEPHPIRCVKD